MTGTGDASPNQRAKLDSIIIKSEKAFLQKGEAIGYTLSLDGRG
jgi:hypothetical protein